MGSPTGRIRVAPDVTESQVALGVRSAVGHCDSMVTVKALPVQQMWVTLWASPVLILGAFV